MANIAVNFQLQTLEGPTSNVVTLSRSGAQLIALNNSIFEQINVAASATDVQTTIPNTANKIITVENTGTVDLTVKFNSSTGTGFIIPKTTGFMAICTTTSVTSVFCSNADTANAGQLKVFIGG